MDLDCEVKQGSLVVHYREPELTAKEANELKAALAAALDNEPVSRIVFDAATVGYIDETGLGALLSLLANDQEVCIASAKPHLAPLFELIRLENSAALFSSVGEALLPHRPS